MKKILAFAGFIIFSQLAHADVYESYRQSGIKALELTKQSEPLKTDLIIAEIKTMIEYGYQIMDLYAAKMPECQEQFRQLKQLSAEISKLTYEQIETLYHDGKGLVPAPRVCYKGRSLVVHPYQVIALAQENRLVSEAEAVEHEMVEVIERAEQIKKLLNP